MSDLTGLVDNLENRISKLLHKYEVLKKAQTSSQEELQQLKSDNQRLTETLEDSEKRLQALQTANALLGSKDYKTETKLKINSLIREIDQCIVQLSE